MFTPKALLALQKSPMLQDALTGQQLKAAGKRFLIGKRSVQESIINAYKIFQNPINNYKPNKHQHRHAQTLHLADLASMPAYPGTEENSWGTAVGCTLLAIAAVSSETAQGILPDDFTSHVLGSLADGSDGSDGSDGLDIHWKLIGMVFSHV